MASEKIAIIGPFGCGKTVLLTVLTHRYQNVSKEGYQIYPDNQNAVKFCQKNWDKLENGEWPGPTSVLDDPVIYKWILRFGKKEKEMITSDIAGEAWRSFIIENSEKSEENGVLSSWQSIKEKWESIPAKLSQDGINKNVMTVEKLLKSATGIYFLLDLGQIIDREVGYEVAIYLPCALEKYMRKIGKKDVPITFVLSKTDKYKYLYDEVHDWDAILKKYILRLPKYDRVLPVSAVAKTKRKKPAQDFPSEGLDDLYRGIWETMKGSSSREMKRSAKRFATFDLPILIGMWGLTFLLAAVSLPLAGVFFVVSIIVYFLCKLFNYITNK